MEIVYFDDATAKMLLRKDNNRPVCDKEVFAFDDAGTMHILYKDSEGKTIRDFIIPSDREPEDSCRDIVDKMEASKRKRLQDKYLKITIFALLTAGIICVTLAVLLSLK